MATATMTSKGQITIPQEIRSYLGLHTGDKLEFIIEESGKVMLEPLATDVRALKSILSKPKKTISIEQMDKIIAKRSAVGWVERKRNPTS